MTALAVATPVVVPVPPLEGQRRLLVAANRRSASKRRLCEISRDSVGSRGSASSSASSSGSSSSILLSKAKNEKSVRFGEVEVATHHYHYQYECENECENEKHECKCRCNDRDHDHDKSQLWYSREDFQRFEMDIQQFFQTNVYQEQAEALQKLYSECLKTAARRGSGGSSLRRGLSGARQNGKVGALSTSTSTGPSTTPTLLQSLQVQVQAEPLHVQPTKDLALETLRGLETAILPDISQRRQLAIQGVLNAQANMANAHPAMKNRSITKTAEYWSRASHLWAQKLAQIDAKQHSFSF